MQPELRAAIVQDASDGRVLMLAWMDDEALRLTRETRRGVVLEPLARRSSGTRARRPGTRSRSRRSATTATATRCCCACGPRAPRATPARRSCFAPALWRTVVERVRDRPEGSYTASLAEAGIERCAQKLGEEAVEAAVAAVARDGRLAEEAADLIYHLYVLLAVAGVDVADVEDELARRAG